MNQIVRTLIISFGIVAGTVVLGVALFATASILAQSVNGGAITCQRGGVKVYHLAHCSA